ncbi:hypothetical protein ACN38_g13011 [Penicillium nordicum]|uniref:Uncharacterized protein n=1 Tax=Penicillium nordicum TaxID=229535 RepID=A0A0M8NNS4_9EURO|nr:hypothetical protein ACN38_g13011 [Penicillium nordicum]
MRHFAYVEVLDQSMLLIYPQIYRSMYGGLDFKSCFFMLSLDKGRIRVFYRIPDLESSQIAWMLTSRSKQEYPDHVVSGSHIINLWIPC